MNNKFKAGIFPIILGIVITLSVIALLNFYPVDSKITEAGKAVTSPVPQYWVETPPVPDEVSLFGEEIPMENIEVYERVEREFIVNTYWHSATLLLMKRANRWFPVIEPILADHGIPDDFKFISMIESNLSNAVSPKGATGYWQFMKDAGRKYGLEINGEVDERYHVQKSTVAACKYLKDSYDKFGSWTLAAASYNMGVNGIRRQAERQKTNNYFEMKLNEETTRYIARAAAMKEIFNYPERYGFRIRENELYPELETYSVTISGPVKHFADFAKNEGVDYKTLKLFNPWLRENYLTNKKKKTYIITLPENKGDYKVY